MIKASVKINLGSLSWIEKLLNPEPLLREVATTLLGDVRRRVHVDGKAADGAEIGAYSNPYLKFRQQGYKSKTVKKGATKGAPRPVMNYNRTGDPKVILSLSRQMENDLAVIEIPNGYGIGWNNSINADKATWNETRYGKEIFKLTAEETNKVTEIATDYIRRVYVE